MVTSKLNQFLYSGGNIAGSLLALGGLGLFFTGIIHIYWWVIVAGLYGAGVLAWPRSSLAETAAAADLSDGKMAHQVQRLINSVVSGLPKECVECLRRIESVLAELLPRLEELRDRGVLQAKDAFTVTETIRRYLPDTLAAYLRLPKLYAQFQPLANGKTASQTLLGQLQILEASLRAVSTSAFEGDAQKLISNGQFLQNRFTEKLAFRA